MISRLSSRLQYSERCLEGRRHHRPRGAVADGLGGITRDKGRDPLPCIWTQAPFHLSNVHKKTCSENILKTPDVRAVMFESTFPPKCFFRWPSAANLILSPRPRHLAYREAQASGGRHACDPVLASSDHILCLGQTPVLHHSSASPSSALGCWCEKNPEIEPASLSLGFQLLQPSSIATVVPGGFRKHLPLE